MINEFGAKILALIALVIFTLIFGWVLMSICCAHVARADPPAAVTGKYHAWFESQMRPDGHFGSCCGEGNGYFMREYHPSDKPGIAFEGEMLERDGHTIFHVEIPADKVNWNSGNPTGRGVVWVQESDGDRGPVICFAPSIGV